MSSGGGMGVVYKAEDTRLNRAVALMFVPEDGPAEIVRHASNEGLRVALRQFLKNVMH